MEFVSENLLLSLNQDLNTLNSVSLKIIQNVKSFEVNSWLFPTKSYKEVSGDIPLNTSKNKQYLLYLELMVDRLYLIINLVANFLETEGKDSKKPSTPKNVIRPKNLSLGASTELMWKNLIDFRNLTIYPCKSGKKAVQDRKLNDKDSQTRTYFSSMCSSCCTATVCIKSIANELVLYNEATSMRKIRNDLQKDICDITQYGCMTRLTTAISEDLKRFFMRLENLEIDNKSSSEKLEKLTSKYSESLTTVKYLERCLRLTKTHFQKVKLKNATLTKNIKKLTHHNQKNEKTLQLEKEKVTTLQKSVEESTISLTLLNTDNDKLQKDYTRVMSDNLAALSEKDAWKSKFTETYLENRRLKSELDRVHSEIRNFRSKMNRITNNCEKLSKKLEKSNAEIDRRSEIFENFIRRIVDVEASRIRDGNVTAALTNPPSVQPFQVKGDPIADMQQQIEANVSTIEKLEQHNKDLIRTIERIQKKSLPI